MDSVVKGKGKKGLIIKTWERCRSLGGIGSKSLSQEADMRKSSRANRGRCLQARRRKINVPKVVELFPKAASQFMLEHSKSWPRSAGEEDDKRAKRCPVAPQGCFSVYVGPQKQRFVIKTECLNHPLFKMLLEEAESEYGYNSEGPLQLPCEVDLFVKVLVEMDIDQVPPRCSFGRTYSSYHLLNYSPKIVSLNKFKLFQAINICLNVTMP